jgi:UDPglucose 6-dehydrogenase
MLPGSTERLQDAFPDIIVLHSPEFLVEKTAAYDAANPQRNIIGVPKDTKEQNEAARRVLEVLPEAPYQEIMPSLDAELAKYAGNCFLYSKVVFMNMLYDVAEKSGANFAVISEAMIHDPRIGRSHMQPVHDSGRGAGGHCFIKDFEALRQFYKESVGEDKAFAMLTAQVAYNNRLLATTGKDIDLLEGVYGKAAVDTSKK